MRTKQIDATTMLNLIHAHEESFRKYLEAMENYEQAKQQLREAVTSVFSKVDNTEETK